MTFVKGYIQTKEHQLEAKKARHLKLGKRTCIVCGKEFNKYTKSQKTCGNKKCKLKSRRLFYEKLREDDPIKSKAFTLFGNIRLGKGKNKIALKMLKSVLGKSCKYCGEIITLDNASVDHKEPRLGSKVYDRKKKKMIYSSKEIRVLDKKENLQIICRDCNRLKSNFNNKQFEIFLNFLNSYPDIGKILRERLNREILFFKK